MKGVFLFFVWAIVANVIASFTGDKVLSSSKVVFAGFWYCLGLALMSLLIVLALRFFPFLRAEKNGEA